MSLLMSLSLSMPMPNGPCPGGPADLLKDYVSSAVARPARRKARLPREKAPQSIHF